VNNTFTPAAWDDYLYWQQTDKKTLRRINDLMKDIRRHPLMGLGKPEQLRGELSGIISRRINQKDRILYEIHATTIIYLSFRGHYDKK